MYILKTYIIEKWNNWETRLKKNKITQKLVY